MIWVLKDNKGIQYRMNHGNGNFDDWTPLTVPGNCIVRGKSCTILFAHPKSVRVAADTPEQVSAGVML